MADGGSFEKLVSGLSLDERHNLLEKLKSQSTLSDEPLYSEKASASPAITIEVEFSRLPWHSRLWYFILGLFKSSSPMKIFEEYRVSSLGNKVQEKTPGLYDYQKGLLLPVFFRQFTRLKEAAHFFYSALDMSVQRDKGAFFAFLGSLIMPDVHKKLQEETDPAFYAENPEVQEAEMRQLAYKAMDDAMLMINEEYRNTMYSNARTLNCLMELSSFLYDRVLMAFENNNAFGGETCPTGVVRGLLVTLNNILFSLKVSPPMTLLQSLFVFILQERANEQGFDMNREIRSLLTKAEGSLAVIRDFNKQIPLTWILRCSTRDMALSPKEISGGEEWFVVYRDYWKRHVDTIFSDFQKDRRQDDLLTSFDYFFKGKSLKYLENTPTGPSTDGIPVRGAFALAFLYTFYSAVFMPDINLILRPILIDGEFQRKENRIEFDEAYNNLIKLEDEIKKFESEISLNGDYGKRYTQAKQEMTSLPVKRRKIQIVVEEANEDAMVILERARNASGSMANLVAGILEKDTKGKYHGLTNLAKIAGKDNQFSLKLNEKIMQFQTVLKLMDDMEAMEGGK
ncbi:MAG: DUF5312 domain-containing protein [Treponema sp.]|jgi:hypothetical protein|nr:DUF5312 domain-containing protein [Treponema sp.]